MKKTMTKMKGLGVVLAAGIIALLQSRTSAEEITLGFSGVFGGTRPASAELPWITASFWSSTPGVVRVAVTNLNLTASENVDLLLFNLNQTVSPVGLKFEVTERSGGFTLPKFSAGANQFKAGGDGKYDLKFSFAQGGGMQTRFTEGEYLVGNLYGLSGITASDFAYTSFPVGGSTPFYAAAHVQRIGDSSSSGWLCTDQVKLTSVPEPDSAHIIIFATTLCFVARAVSRVRAARRG